MEVCKGAAQLEEPLVVITIVAVLARHDAPLGFEASVELLTDHTMVGQ